VSITKVVLFFTTNPTKLSLKFSEFSTIFHAFYKFLQTRYTIEVIVLHRSPWKTFQIYTKPLVRVKLPGKSWPLAIGSLGIVADGAGPNSGAPASESAGEREEDG
jgi:hypothetical protein